MDVTEIGNKIKKRRAVLEMTQKDLARKMNVSNQLISKWETGESVPSLEYLDALCKALGVGYSYFTSDGDEPPATQPPKAGKKRKSASFWKWFALILTFAWVAAFVAGFVLLTYYVFVPAASRTRYFQEIETAFQNYFDLGYYSIQERSELDGDVKTDCRYDGYLDENGKAVFYDTCSGKTVKDGILTISSGSTKYHYIQDREYATVEELAEDRISASSEDDDPELWNDGILDKISYIRKVKGGYYLEFKDEYLLDELSGSQKKNTKLTEKIKGKIDIKNGLYSFMEVTVKYLNKPDNEHFTVKASYEFIAERPVIEHINLEGREWLGTYVGDIWHSPYEPDVTPDQDTTPKCEELLTAEEFVSRLTGGKAKKLEQDPAFTAMLFDGKIKDGGDCYYYLDGTRAIILNKTDLTKKAAVELPSFNGAVTNVYVYGGNVFYTDCPDGISPKLRYFRVKNIAGGNAENYFGYVSAETDDIIFNGGFALYFADNKYNLFDLNKKEALYSYSDIAFRFLDSAGNVYCERSTQNDYVPAVMKNGEAVTLKGSEYFYMPQGAFSTILTVDGDSVFTCEGNKVYRYENGELKETLTASDPRFKQGYTKLANGYCLTGKKEVFDKNGNAREFESFKLKTSNGWETVHGIEKILAAANGKLIVNTAYYGGYVAVYGENDLTKPEYCMQRPDAYDNYCDFGEVEFLYLGSTTFVAVRTSKTDYYGYDLYHF